MYPAAGFTDWDRDYGEHVHLVRFTPHDWLLPRTAAAVHHGGAGTTHGALAAGVPQGVIPFSLDQPYFARRVAALGLGPGGLDPGRTDVEGPTRILTDLTRGERAEGYRRRAREAAREAARAVERRTGRGPRPGSSWAPDSGRGRAGQQRGRAAVEGGAKTARGARAGRRSSGEEAQTVPNL